VRTTDANGCLSQSVAINDSVLVQITTSITTSTLTDETSIYAYDKLVHVVVYDDKLLGSTMHIYNTAGEVIYTAPLTASQTAIDLKSFAAGVYIVQIEGKQPLVVKKISIE
jgi:hypothetical protein